jgi:hypothetical protein
VTCTTPCVTSTVVPTGTSRVPVSAVKEPPLAGSEIRTRPPVARSLTLRPKLKVRTAVTVAREGAVVVPVIGVPAPVVAVACLAASVVA